MENETNQTSNGKLEILVVEDREENILAAKSAFNANSQINVEYARTYEEAITRLKQKLYAGIISDVHFPRTEGREPEDLGLDFLNEAGCSGRYCTPTMLLTGGKDHDTTITLIIDPTKNYPGDIKTRNGYSEEKLKYYPTRTTCLTKENPSPWNDALNMLLDEGTIRLYEAKLRYLSSGGKLACLLSQRENKELKGGNE